MEKCKWWAREIGEEGSFLFRPRKVTQTGCDKKLPETPWYLTAKPWDGLGYTHCPYCGKEIEVLNEECV